MNNRFENPSILGRCLVFSPHQPPEGRPMNFSIRAENSCPEPLHQFLSNPVHFQGPMPEFVSINPRDRKSFGQPAGNGTFSRANSSNQPHDGETVLGR